MLFIKFLSVSACEYFLKMSTYSVLCVHGSSLCSEVEHNNMFLGKNNTIKVY